MQMTKKLSWMDGQSVMFLHEVKLSWAWRLRVRVKAAMDQERLALESRHFLARRALRRVPGGSGGPCAPDRGVHGAPSLEACAPPRVLQPSRLRGAVRAVELPQVHPDAG